MIIIGKPEGEMFNCSQKKCTSLSMVGCVKGQGVLRGSKIEVKLTGKGVCSVQSAVLVDGRG